MSKKVNKNSQTYWKKRTDEIFAHIDQMDYDYFYELQSIYSESAQQIQKEIYNFYAKYAEDNNISLQEAKKRLMGEDLSDYRANAKKYFKQAEKDPELLKRLNEQYVAGKVTRLEALYLELEYQKGVLSGNLHNSFETYLKKVADYAYKKIGGGLSASTLNKEAIKQLVNTPLNGKNYSQSIWGNTDTLASDLREVLKRGFIRGHGSAEIARELRKKHNVARSRAEAIIRTDGTNIVNNATAKRYKEAGLTKYQFHAHIDSRTTDICKSENENIYLLDDFQPGTNAPPMHINCRSTIIPVEEELDGKVESNSSDEENRDIMRVEQEKRVEFLKKEMSNLEDEIWGDLTEDEANDLYLKYDKELVSLEANLARFKTSGYSIHDTTKYFNDQSSYINWKSRLTREDLFYIRRYTGADYVTYNRYLRYTEDELKTSVEFRYESKSSMKKLENDVNKLTKALEGYVPEYDFTVFRGVGGSEAVYEVGSTQVVDRGFMSTSVFEGVGKSFEDKKSSTLYKINIKKGSNVGSYISEFSEYASEKEFLIKPGTEFKVVDIQVEDKNGYVRKIIELETI